MSHEKANRCSLELWALHCKNYIVLYQLSFVSRADSLYKHDLVNALLLGRKCTCFKMALGRTKTYFWTVLYKEWSCLISQPVKASPEFGVLYWLQIGPELHCEWIKVKKFHDALVLYDFFLSNIMVSWWKSISFTMVSCFTFTLKKVHTKQCAGFEYLIVLKGSDSMEFNKKDFIFIFNYVCMYVAVCGFVHLNALQRWGLQISWC